MSKTHLERTLISLAGEFAVASQLCLRGYQASLTLKNFPKIDVFAYNPKNQKTISIQVKTSTTAHFDPKSIDIKNRLVYVYIKPDKSLEFYIIPVRVALRKRKRVLNKRIENSPKIDKSQPVWLDSNKFRKYKDKWKNLGLD